jgi:ABC-type molybdate transport system ATPase subunit
VAGCHSRVIHSKYEINVYRKSALQHHISCVCIFVILGNSPTHVSSEWQMVSGLSKIQKGFYLMHNLVWRKNLKAVVVNSYVRSIPMIPTISRHNIHPAGE